MSVFCFVTQLGSLLGVQLDSLSLVASTGATCLAKSKSWSVSPEGHRSSLSAAQSWEGAGSGVRQ